MSNLFSKIFTNQNTELTKQKFEVIGTLPDWLNGNLYRNGPGKFEYGNTQLTHVFDGPAMIHHFSFQKGMVFYQNKFLQTEILKDSEKTGQITAQEYATDYRTVFQKLQGVVGIRPKVTDNANVNVLRIKDDLMAITSTPANIQFDPATIETYGKYQFDDEHQFFGTPHPSLDLETGDIYDVASVIAANPAYIFYKIHKGTNKRSILATVKTPQLGYIHSFANTKTSLVMIEFPYFISVFKLGITQKTYSESLNWQPDKGVNFIIVNKETGAVKKIPYNDVFAFYHISNSFEKDNKIIIDIPLFNQPNEKDFNLKAIIHDGLNLDKYDGFYRFSIDKTSNEIKKEKISDSFIDLERINDQAYNGKEYQFTYGVSQCRDSVFFDRLIKIDVQNKTEKIWHKADVFPGEPVFIPKPNGIAEDDGVLLSVFLDGKTQNSVLIVLDAKNMTELARVCLPQHIPFGFHGQFYEM